MRIVIDRKKESINEILDVKQLQGFSFVRQPIHARSRKLHSSFTLEAQQDIKAMRGIDMMQSMLNSLMLDQIEITHFDRIIHYIPGEDLCLTAKNCHLKTS